MTPLQRIKNYGFSFPQWRFLTQSFDGPSLVERFGMRRLTRETDVRDASLPDPQRDRFGTGFCIEVGEWYIEYRRAYIALTGPDGGLIIRNNSRFFGHDRLPSPVYLALDPLPVDVVQSINEITVSEHFIAWREDDEFADVGDLLDRIDAFDAKLNSWLRDPAGGLPHLVSFLEYKRANQMPLPYITAVEPQLPPWSPKCAIVPTESVLRELAEYYAGGALTDPQLKLVFDPAVKLVLMSGKGGDFPF